MNSNYIDTQEQKKYLNEKPEDDIQFKLIKQHFRVQFKQSFKYVGFYLLFSFGKYLACFYSLQQRDNQCDVNPLFIWLTIVGMYEFFNSIRYLAILYSLQMNSKDIFLLVLKDMLVNDNNLTQPINLDQMEQRNKRACLKRLIKQRLAESPIPAIDSNLDPPFSLWEVIHQAEVLNKYTRVMKVYNQFVYYMIFTGGNLAYFSSDSNDCDSQLNNVTFVLLLIGYLFSAFLIVGFGLAILSMGFYLPVILFLFIFKSIGNLCKRYQTQKKFKQMKKHHFIECTSMMSQCHICMFEYEKGDQIMELPCNSRHNFHKDCLNSWLLIKQQCPVCRSAI